MSAEAAARGWYSRSEETRMVSRREEMQRTLCCLPSVLFGSLTGGCGRERQRAADPTRPGHVCGVADRLPRGSGAQAVIVSGQIKGGSYRLNDRPHRPRLVASAPTAPLLSCILLKSTAAGLSDSVPQLQNTRLCHDIPQWPLPCLHEPRLPRDDLPPP